MYVWTMKAEERAKALGLEERKAGTQAYYGKQSVDLYGTIIKAWAEAGYIEELKFKC